MNRMTYLDAGKAALAEEMRRDPRVWALGEDLGRGGVFGQYRGLAEEFGSARIVDAPISEAAIMGSAVGAALAGTRPVVEMRFSDFALCAIDELVNQAAKARYMFGGQSKVPLVAREPVGMWRSSAAQHSQSLESWYTHIPGLVVVMPSTPADNKGLLKSAIRCDDPVVYMEHKDLWGLEGDVPGGEGHIVPLGVANIVTRRRRRHHRDLVEDGARGAGGGPLACPDRHRGRSHRSPHPLAMGHRDGLRLCVEDRPARHRPRSSDGLGLWRGDRGVRRGGMLRRTARPDQAPRLATRTNCLCAASGGHAPRGCRRNRRRCRLADSVADRVPYRACARKLPSARLATEAMTSAPPTRVAGLGCSSARSHTHIGDRMNSMRMSSVSSAPGT